MAYKSKYGVTAIIDKDMNNLIVSRDTDTDFESDSDEEFPVAVLMYTPTMKNTDVHYHIPLNVAQAKELAKWLKKFVKEHSND